MNKNILKLSLLCALSVTAPVAAKDTSNVTHPHQKIVLFGPRTLLYTDIDKIKGAGFGSMLGFTPEKVEKELLEALEPINVKQLTNYTRTYPALIEAWLTNALTTPEVHAIAHAYVKKHAGMMKKLRLNPAIDIAFSSKQAGTFSAYNDSHQLAKKCKSKGLTIGICSSWNRESFDNLKRVQSGALGFFDAYYISGYMGILAATPAFYDDMLKDYAAENICLVDCLPENIRSAKARGINTIFFSGASAAEKELKKLGFL